jgi:hypothetical protein
MDLVRETRVKTRQRLTPLLTLERGVIALNEEEEKLARQWLINIWNCIVSDMIQAYKDGGGKGEPSQENIREVILDSYYPSMYGTTYARGSHSAGKEVSPNLEFLFAFPYAKESGRVLEKIAKKIKF